MRHLLTSLALLATFTAAGQTANPFPYNPDADADGWISVNDLLSLLSIFTMEFTPESWETDSLSAAVVLNGNINYFASSDVLDAGFRGEEGRPQKRTADGPM